MIVSNVKRDEIISKYKLKSSSHLTKLIKQKERIIESYERLNAKQLKTSAYVSQSKYPDVEEALVLWIRQMRDKKISLSSDLIREKAVKFAEDMGYTDFKATNRYIKGLKKRHQIEWTTIRGESESVNPEVVTNWQKELESEINGFDSKDIYNLDETALFWRILPNKTYAFGNESKKGVKQLKNRVTLVLITNADGSDKRAVMIGQSKNPRAFRKVKSLPIDYYNQKNAWIDVKIFNQILSKIDRQMKRNNRKIKLFVDNCRPHKITVNLTNISVVFFPKNTTSVCQVIRNY
jgi:hypothetical protein